MDPLESVACYRRTAGTNLFGATLDSLVAGPMGQVAMVDSTSWAPEEDPRFSLF